MALSGRCGQRSSKHSAPHHDLRSSQLRTSEPQYRQSLTGVDVGDLDLFARLDANERLVIELQQAMLARADKQRRELDEIRRTIEVSQLEPKSKSSPAKRAGAIGSIIAAIIVAVLNHGIQNGWIPTTTKKPPAELEPIQMNR